MSDTRVEKRKGRGALPECKMSSYFFEAIWELGNEYVGEIHVKSCRILVPSLSSELV